MRWKLPKTGDIRIITKFALFPIQANGEKRWLETVHIKQRCWVGIVSGTVYWDNVAFVDEPKEMKTNG
jgi:hypothetical protein